MSTQQIRRDLEKLLGMPVPEKVWRYLEERYFVSEVAKGLATADDLAVEARTLLDLGGPQATKPMSSRSAFLEAISEESLGDRKSAMSELVAGLAGRSPAVQQFRREFLSNGLLQIEQVEEWINGRAEEDGPSELSVSVPLDGSIWKVMGGKVRIDPPLKVSVAPPYARFTRHVLAYARPDSEWAYNVPVRVGGVLHRLAMLSEHLEKQYTWQRAQATTFVLTGLIPLLSSIRVDINRKFQTETLSQITITVDPTVSPKAVSDAFKKARAEVLTGRPRSLSVKHVELVLFCDKRPDEETWAARMEAWNGQHPEWAYTEPKNFLRDANQGLRRLLGRSFKFTSSQGADE